MPATHFLQRWYRIAFALLLLQLTACSLLLSPAERIDQLAQHSGLTRQLVTGERFSHVVYNNHFSGAVQRLHVYIEGDGRAWRSRYQLADDPTTGDPLMLRLLLRDTAPALYLGRPCYSGLSETPPCNPYYWSRGRYSEEVVSSMAAALQRLRQQFAARELVLIGHSGGGTLAMLLAGRIAEVRGVITLAANLDIEKWTAQHHYSPLTGSLNPAKQPPLDADITQLHLFGAEDNTIAFKPVRRVVGQQPNAFWQLIKGCGHRDCWETMWPAPLQSLFDVPGGRPRTD